MIRALAILAALAFGAAVWLLWVAWRRAAAQTNHAKALTEFSACRVRLQEDFRAAANVTGKPRGLVWTKCDFGDNVVLARDRANGELIGLVGVTISFEAVPGGGMEDVEAVGNLRAATAVLTWNGHDWTTAGRAVFNLEPKEVVERFRDSLASIPDAA